MSLQEKNSKIEFIKTALTLFVIAAFVAVLLAFANYFTAPVIQKSAQNRLNQSLNSLMNDAVRFENVTDQLAVVDFMVPVLAAYRGVDQNEVEVGYCIHIAPKGYSNEIEMMVAIDGEGIVRGTRILSISDTPGVGMKVQSDEEFQNSVIGRSNPINIVKIAPDGPNDVQVISGATVSSTAYLNGVNTAIDAAAFLMKGVA